MILHFFKEYGAEDAPSMLDSCENLPYPGKEKIIRFLNDKGTVTIVSTQLPFDRITGERISGELYSKQFSDFIWCSDLAYHVEKYNLRLPKEFEDYVLSL